MSEFSANAGKILEIGQLLGLLRSGKEMAQNFQDGTSYYKGCWGVEGDDAFANAVVPQVEKMVEGLTLAVGAVDQVVHGVVEALGGDALAVKKPQDAALEDIQQQGGVRR
ncbi:hypothetical protein [Streptomyces sp. NEAU-W12]|uniref:hypothetical protein n=1 Tax=Streptomyces sp. NEAU-W12 TaxID=2994668 RepID=UPI00224AF2DB|nr:hypothetical protein [Streptomyces sp. NEAU-W12]MCX2923462.1 hypothetical protein [Streptomyces sp. NEAU-W12]